MLRCRRHSIAMAGRVFLSLLLLVFCCGCVRVVLAAPKTEALKQPKQGEEAHSVDSADTASSSGGGGSSTASKLDAVVGELVAFMTRFGQHSDHGQAEFEQAGLHVENLLASLTEEESALFLPRLHESFQTTSPNSQHEMIFRLLTQGHICDARHSGHQG